MEEEVVVLVDARDNEVGTAPKLQAHREGSLHRAVSVFVFNERGQTLLQRRAEGKYHSSGLWSNACCSHPRPGERPHAAAIRRLEEEMGVQSPLRHVFSFIYRAELDRGLSEHELDHVFVGRHDSDPSPDPEEVGEWRWVDPAELRSELRDHPERFSAWFPIAWRLLEESGEVG
jgi:isopentenyl-diphosphate Delta-isomerase